MDSLEGFHTVWKVSGQPCNFLDSFQTVRNDLHTFLYAVNAIYALLAYMSRNKNLRTSSGKFLRVKVCRPESWDFFRALG